MRASPSRAEYWLLRLVWRATPDEAVMPERIVDMCNRGYNLALGDGEVWEAIEVHSNPEDGRRRFDVASAQHPGEVWRLVQTMEVTC